jgi:predicted DNA binding CopG/RHH family protein
MLIPEMKSYEEIAEFWDTHSLADYWDQTQPAEFEFSPELHRRYLVAVEPNLLKRIRQAAHERGVSTESLVNLLLEQRLHEIETA